MRRREANPRRRSPRATKSRAQLSAVAQAAVRRARKRISTRLLPAGSGTIICPCLGSDSASAASHSRGPAKPDNSSNRTAARTGFGASTTNTFRSAPVLHRYSCSVRRTALAGESVDLSSAAAAQPAATHAAVRMVVAKRGSIRTSFVSLAAWNTAAHASSRSSESQYVDRAAKHARSDEHQCAGKDADTRCREEAIASATKSEKHADSTSSHLHGNCTNCSFGARIQTRLLAGNISAREAVRQGEHHGPEKPRAFPTAVRKRSADSSEHHDQYGDLGDLKVHQVVLWVERPGEQEVFNGTEAG